MTREQMSSQDKYVQPGLDTINSLQVSQPHIVPKTKPKRSEELDQARTPFWRQTPAIRREINHVPEKPHDTKWPGVPQRASQSPRTEGTTPSSLQLEADANAKVQK